jgi:hypothetical protein
MKMHGPGNIKKLGYSYGKMLGSKIAWANSKGVDKVRVGPDTKQVMEGNDPHGGHGRVCEGDMARVGVRNGMTEVELLR